MILVHLSHRHCKYVICALASVSYLSTLVLLGFPAGLSRFLSELAVHSLLQHLFITTCCVSTYFRLVLKPEKVHSPSQGAQPEIFSEEGWKKHTLFGRKHTLFRRRE